MFKCPPQVRGGAFTFFKFISADGTHTLKVTFSYLKFIYGMNQVTAHRPFLFIFTTESIQICIAAVYWWYWRRELLKQVLYDSNFHLPRDEEEYKPGTSNTCRKNSTNHENTHVARDIRNIFRFFFLSRQRWKLPGSRKRYNQGSRATAAPPYPGSPCHAK